MTPKPESALRRNQTPNTTPMVIVIVRLCSSLVSVRHRRAAADGCGAMTIKLVVRPVVLRRRSVWSSRGTVRDKGVWDD